jgi:hypothetical protein
MIPTKEGEIKTFLINKWTPETFKPVCLFKSNLAKERKDEKA